MVDVFDEVEEQLRADRYRSLAVKSAPWLLAVVVAIALGVGGYWAYDSYQKKVSGAAAESYAQALDAINARDLPKAKAALQKISTSAPKAYRSMALMQLAAFAITDDKRDEAVKLFDQAAEVDPDPLLADAARLKSAFTLMDTAPYAEIEKRLTPLTGETRPYRAQAKEALAFAKLMGGDPKGARSDFSVITLMSGATDDMRQRAQLAIAAIDTGVATQLPAIAKAAMALPKPTEAELQAAAQARAQAQAQATDQAQAADQAQGGAGPSAQDVAKAEAVAKARAAAAVQAAAAQAQRSAQIPGSAQAPAPAPAGAAQ